MGHRLSRIVTRTGDAGTTGLGDGSRTTKDSLRIDAMGEVDELNSSLGVLLCEELPDTVRGALLDVQNDLFDLGGELCLPGMEVVTTKGIKISWFPAVHDRNGSVSYLLEWNGLSMFFSGDTRPNNFMMTALTNVEKPVNLLIHETVLPPEVWAGLANGGQVSSTTLATARAVQENSHTPQLALRYMLRQAQLASRAPRLAVATHFQASDDTIRPAFDAVRRWYTGPFTIVTDLVVINVSKTRILERRAVVSDYAQLRPPADPRTTSPFYPQESGLPKHLRKRRPMARPLRSLHRKIRISVISQRIILYPQMLIIFILQPTILFSEPS